MDKIKDIEWICGTCHKIVTGPRFSTMSGRAECNDCYLDRAEEEEKKKNDTA